MSVNGAPGLEQYGGTIRDDNFNDESLLFGV